MKTAFRKMTRLRTFAAACALVLGCAACGGPEPKVYEMDIPGLGVEPQTDDVVVGVDGAQAEAEAVSASVTY